MALGARGTYMRDALWQPASRARRRVDTLPILPKHPLVLPIGEDFLSAGLREFFAQPDKNVSRETFLE
jgi:hypothetical protein